MNEDALCLLHGIFYEVKYLASDGVALLVIIEEDLILLVQPVELEVCDADGLPMIGYLPAGAVYHMRDLVGHHEFEVLCGELIADKQPVLDFDGPYHVVGEGPHHHLLLHHLLLLLLMKHGLHMRLVLLVAPSWARSTLAVVGLLLLLRSHFVLFQSDESLIIEIIIVPYFI